MESSMVETTSNVSKHQLSDKWVLWAHLPHDTDWSLTSYIKIMEFNYLDNLLLLQRAIPEKMIKNCMLFLMKKDVNPTWEDPKNKEGGCFSFKVVNKSVYASWNRLLINLTTNNICWTFPEQSRSTCRRHFGVGDTLLLWVTRIILLQAG